MDEHPIYGPLGIRPIINADTTLTVLGSPLTSPAVLGVMAAAADVYVDMHELAGAVADRLAELTRNEAALVTAGAAAGLMLGAWACMSGDDEAAIARADDQDATSFTTNEIVVQCSQQNPYVIVLRTAGARIVEVGDANGTRPEQLDRGARRAHRRSPARDEQRLGAWRHRSRRGRHPRPRTGDSRNRRRRRANYRPFRICGT